MTIDDREDTVTEIGHTIATIVLRRNRPESLLVPWSLDTRI